MIWSLFSGQTPIQDVVPVFEAELTFDLESDLKSFLGPDPVAGPDSRFDTGLVLVLESGFGALFGPDFGPDLSFFMAYNIWQVGKGKFLS